jgi:hypothetical protein
VAQTQEGLVAALSNVADLDRGACRRAAEERFSAERMVAEHVAIYENVMQGRDRAVFGDAHGRPTRKRDVVPGRYRRREAIDVPTSPAVSSGPVDTPTASAV